MFRPRQKLDGVSSVFFASHQTGGPRPLQGVIAHTEVWYRADGEIEESDIVINDVDFEVTRDPTAAPHAPFEGTPSSSSVKPRVNLDAVLTHEIGHALGIGHSQAFSSTMHPMHHLEQTILSCEERHAVSSLFGSSATMRQGSISGRIYQGGRSVFGSQVLAISARRGTIVATTLSGIDGEYRLEALEPGIYYLFTEPQSIPSLMLPPYYGGVSTRLCPGDAHFRRTFLMAPDRFHLRALRVDSAQCTRAPDLEVQCEAQWITPLYPPGALEIQLETGVPYFGIVDRAVPGNHRDYLLLPIIAGHLKLHLLTHSLRSPIEAQMQLRRASGEVPARHMQPSFVGASGFSFWDAALVAETLEADRYQIRIEPRALAEDHRWAPHETLDADPYLILIGQLGLAPADAQGLDALNPSNPRCAADPPFGDYESPAGPPALARSYLQHPELAGGCSTLAEAHAGAHTHAGGTFGKAISWAIPWLLASGLSALLRSRLWRRRVGTRSFGCF